MNIQQIAQAVAIASDPAQSVLHHQALQFIADIQQNASETWRLALPIFVDRDEQGIKRHTPQTRFFALRVLDEFLDNRSASLASRNIPSLSLFLDSTPWTTTSSIPSNSPSWPTSRQSTSEGLQNQTHPVCLSHSLCSRSHSFTPIVLRNKFSHTLTLFFLCTYIDRWPSFFDDLFILIRTPVPNGVNGSTTNFNRHVSLLFFHIVLEISGEVADQTIKAARSWSHTRHQRDARVRDAVRERAAAKVNEAVLLVVTEAAERMAHLRKLGSAGNHKKDLDAAVETVDWGIRTFGSYVGMSPLNSAMPVAHVNFGQVGSISA